MNYQDARNGRIWVGWDPNYYTVQMIKTEAQLIHSHVKSNTCTMNCLLTVVYGYVIIEQMTVLWKNLKEVAHGINIPWLVTGDFNAVMAPQDIVFGNPVTYAETKDYVDCMQGLMLNKLQWKGEYYT